MTDKKIIQYLQSVCRFQHVMENDCCTEISFYNEEEVFGGTLRKHPLKNQIINMVAKLQHLKHLNIRKCKINQRPNMDSRHLEYIDISCNDLESVPNWVSEQPNLRFLSLGANKITHVPDLSALPLETLKLHKNSITTFPKVGKKIKSLNLYLNKMDAIPKSVLDLSLLEVFSFGVTKMKSLPNLSPLPNLRWLVLTVNDLEYLPDDLCSLQKLEGLQLAKNKLKKLPNQIGDMTSLKALSVYSNEITDIPESFFKLKLKKLNMALNPLKAKENIIKTFKDIDFISI